MATTIAVWFTIVLVLVSPIVGLVLLLAWIDRQRMQAKRAMLNCCCETRPFQHKYDQACAYRMGGHHDARR